MLKMPKKTTFILRLVLRFIFVLLYFSKNYHAVFSKFLQTLSTKKQTMFVFFQSLYKRNYRKVKNEEIYTSSIVGLTIIVLIFQRLE